MDPLQLVAPRRRINPLTGLPEGDGPAFDPNAAGPTGSLESMLPPSKRDSLGDQAPGRVDRLNPLSLLPAPATLPQNRAPSLAGLLDNGPPVVAPRTPQQQIPELPQIGQLSPVGGYQPSIAGLVQTVTGPSGTFEYTGGRLTGRNGQPVAPGQTERDVQYQEGLAAGRQETGMPGVPSLDFLARNVFSGGPSATGDAGLDAFYRRQQAIPLQQAIAGGQGKLEDQRLRNQGQLDVANLRPTRDDILRNVIVEAQRHGGDPRAAVQNAAEAEALMQATRQQRSDLTPEQILGNSRGASIADLVMQSITKGNATSALDQLGALQGDDRAATITNLVRRLGPNVPGLGDAVVRQYVQDLTALNLDPSSQGVPVTLGSDASRRGSAVFGSNVATLPGGRNVTLPAGTVANGLNRLMMSGESEQKARARLAAIGPLLQALQAYGYGGVQ